MSDIASREAVERLNTIAESCCDNASGTSDLVWVSWMRQMIQASTALLTRAEAAEDRQRAAEDFISARGYRRCDIPACNCNSWHGGNAEDRLQEIRECLAENDVSMNGKTFVDAINEAFAALRAQMAWQPIETAPRDGTWIEGYELGRSPEDAIKVWQWYDPWPKPGYWLDAADQCDGLEQPTHWRPLPTPLEAP